MNANWIHTHTHTLGMSLLWMSICSLVLVTAVVFEGAVVLVTDETVEACIFSNNLHTQTNKRKDPFSHLNINCDDYCIIVFIVF